MKGVLRNIKNALNDPRLKGKLQVELVAFGDGVEIFKKFNGLDTLLLALQQQGVILAQCENTICERKISKDDLWPFISYVQVVMEKLLSGIIRVGLPSIRSESRNNGYLFVYYI